MSWWWCGGNGDGDGDGIALCMNNKAERITIAQRLSSERIMTYPLKKVTLEADVYMVCLEHALSTENFEVMGLLIGDNVEGVTSISAMKISSRSDKKKDRVEISPSESVKAWEEAERLTKELHKTMRVIGWYHSHPHITICPSQIDINTQQLYQTMECSFVGLIFSVFSEDQTTKEQEVMLTCFQSCHGSSKEIPLEIIYTPNISIWCCRSMIELPQILVQEEKNVAENCKNHPDILVHICNNAVHIQALCHITDIVTKPLVQALSERLISNKKSSVFLQDQIDNLKKLLINP